MTAHPERKPDALDLASELKGCAIEASFAADQVESHHDTGDRVLPSVLIETRVSLATAIATIDQYLGRPS